MNTKLLILTGVFIARVFAYGPCSTGTRHYQACCRRTPFFLKNCRLVLSDIENVAEFEEICQKYERVPRCCANFVITVGIDCVDPEEINQ
ncbi:hypothetical protein V8C43DRAFT_294944 [Trichoderma afarasin]